MKRRSVTRIISVFVLIFAFVAMMCMFANAFDGEAGCARGNVWSVVFGLQEGYNPVWPLIIGFVGVALLIVAAAAGILIGEAGGKTLAFSEIGIGAIVGILFLLSIIFYSGANPNVDMASTADNALGAGTICVSVFSFLVAGLGVIDLLVHKK